MKGIQKMIKVVDLKRNEVSEEIANKYFVTSWCMPLDRFHLPKLTAEEYNETMENLRKELSADEIRKIREDNFSYSTATDYYKSKIQLAIIAKDFGVSPKQISLKDYIYDEKFYEVFDTDMQIYYYNCIFHTPTASEDKTDAIREEYNTCAIDRELWDKLYDFCSIAIRTHKAMLFSDIDKAVGICNRILEDTQGFKTNTTKAQGALLKKYFNQYKAMFEDSKFAEYIVKNDDVKVFAENESTRTMFIDEYVKLYNLIGHDFTETEVFEDYVSLEIIEVLNINIEFTSYRENDLYDSEDEDEYYEEEEEEYYEDCLE
jgi:hypothetical protein